MLLRYLVTTSYVQDGNTFYIPGKNNTPINEIRTRLKGYLFEVYVKAKDGRVHTKKSTVNDGNLLRWKKYKTPIKEVKTRLEGYIFKVYCENWCPHHIFAF